jgi:hypothetical protein
MLHFPEHFQPHSCGGESRKARGGEREPVGVTQLKGAQG